MTTTRQSFSHFVGDVGGQLQQAGVNITYGDNYVAAQTLTGVSPSHSKIDKKEIIVGRFINDIDLKERRKTLVLSRSQAKELAKDYRAMLGKNVKVDNLSFKVVGIYKDDESRQNNEAFSAFSTVKTIYAKGDPLQVNILGSGDDGEYQSHGIAHHHPVAQGGVLPVIYLHAHIGEHVDKHGTRIADHQQEEEQDTVVDDPELEHLHDEIR